MGAYGVEASDVSDMLLNSCDHHDLILVLSLPQCHPAQSLSHDQKMHHTPRSNAYRPAGIHCSVGHLHKTQSLRLVCLSGRNVGGTEDRRATLAVI